MFYVLLHIQCLFLDTYIGWIAVCILRSSRKWYLNTKARLFHITHKNTDFFNPPKYGIKTFEHLFLHINLLHFSYNVFGDAGRMVVVFYGIFAERRTLNLIYANTFHWFTFLSVHWHRFSGHSCDDFHWFCISHDLSQEVRIQCVCIQFACGSAGDSMGIPGKRCAKTRRWSHSVSTWTNKFLWHL